MLGKLIKYNFRSCYKTFWTIWLAIIVISIINGFSLIYCGKFEDYSFFANTLPKLLLFGVAVASYVIALIYIYKEFTHGLLGNQGYLMFTLPANEDELIMSKAITALIMEVISGVVVVICLFIMGIMCAPEYMLYLIKDTWRLLRNTDILLFSAFIIEGLILVATSLMTINFHIYTASAVGHLSMKNRKAIFVAVYLLICILSATLSVNVVAPIIASITSNHIFVTWKSDMYLAMEIFGMIILAELLYTAVMYFITRGIIKNKLNLE